MPCVVCSAVTAGSLRYCPEHLPADYPRDLFEDAVEVPVPRIDSEPYFPAHITVVIPFKLTGPIGPAVPNPRPGRFTRLVRAARRWLARLLG